jgi:uncharacterized protein
MISNVLQAYWSKFSTTFALLLFLISDRLFAFLGNIFYTLTQDIDTVNIISQILTFVLLPTLVIMLLGFKPKLVFKLNPLPLKLLLIYFGLGIILIPLKFLPKTVNLWLLEDILNKSVATLPERHYLLSFLFTFLVAPICEEVFNRGVLLSNLNGLRFGEKIIFSGILFSLFHNDPSYALHTFVSGMLLAYLYLTSQSLLAPTFCHAGGNLLPALLSANTYQATVAQTSLQTEIWGSLFISLGGLVLLIGLLFKFKSEMRKTGLPQTIQTEKYVQPPRLVSVVNLILFGLIVISYIYNAYFYLI